VEKSSLSGKMGLSLLFLIMPIIRWTRSKIMELLLHPISLL
ncbi:hypothetical protein N338_02538, partial [Podiceps cristatus]